jgi:hypothetical protein
MPRIVKRHLAVGLLLLIACGRALADSPLPPPQALTFCSRTGTFCAVSDPVEKITRISLQRSRKAHWSIPGWHRWMFVSDDGVSVVVGYQGMNLVPRDVAMDEPVLLFYSRGKRVRTVTLGQLYRRKSQLIRTSSHLAWVRSIGFNKANQLVVELVNGNKVAFAAGSGQVERLVPDSR